VKIKFEKWVYGVTFKYEGNRIDIKTHTKSCYNNINNIVIAYTAVPTSPTDGTAADDVAPPRMAIDPTAVRCSCSGGRGRRLCAGGGCVHRKNIVIIYRYVVRVRTRHGGARSAHRWVAAACVRTGNRVGNATTRGKQQRQAATDAPGFGGRHATRSLARSTSIALAIHNINIIDTRLSLAIRINIFICTHLILL